MVPLNILVVFIKNNGIVIFSPHWTKLASLASVGSTGNWLGKARGGQKSGIAVEFLNVFLYFVFVYVCIFYLCVFVFCICVYLFLYLCMFVFSIFLVGIALERQKVSCWKLYFKSQESWKNYSLSQKQIIRF